MNLQKLKNISRFIDIAKLVFNWPTFLKLFANLQLNSFTTYLLSLWQNVTIQKFDPRTIHVVKSILLNSAIEICRLANIVKKIMKLSVHFK